MIEIPIISFEEIRDNLFLTEKGRIIYAYCDNERLLIGNAKELANYFQQMTKKFIAPIDGSEIYQLENGYAIPRPYNSFLTVMQIKCIN